MMYLVGSIIIFVFMLLTYISRVAENNLIKGFWRADAEFCEQAELEMFVLYLGDNNGYINQCRNGYMLATNNRGVIINNPIKLTLSGNINLMPGMAKCKNYNAYIDWQETPLDDPDTFPSELQVTYYPKYGKLVLWKNDQVLASLWKDCQMSAMAADVDLLPESTIDRGVDDGDDNM